MREPTLLLIDDAQLGNGDGIPRVHLQDYAVFDFGLLKLAGGEIAVGIGKVADFLRFLGATATEKS